MLKCPICKKPVDEASIGKPRSTFPFCSDRCKLIDLGRWLNGSDQIPVEEHDEGSDDDQLRVTPTDPRRR